VRPVFENLFRNPDFRKALEPGFLERDRKIFAEAAAYPGPSAFRPADYWSKTGISLPKPKPAMRQRDAELTARLTGRWVAAAFVLKQIERESDGKMQEKSQMVNDQVMEFRPNGDLIILTPTDDKLTIQAGQWKILNGDLYMVLNKDLLPSKQRLVFKSKSEVELVMDPVFLQNVLEQQQKRLGQKIRYKVMTGRDGRSVDVEAIEKSSSVLIIFPNNVLRKSIPGRLTIPKGK